MKHGTRERGSANYPERVDQSVFLSTKRRGHRTITAPTHEQTCSTNGVGVFLPTGGDMPNTYVIFEGIEALLFIGGVCFAVWLLGFLVYVLIEWLR